MAYKLGQTYSIELEKENVLGIIVQNFGKNFVRMYGNSSASAGQFGAIFHL